MAFYQKSRLKKPTGNIGYVAIAGFGGLCYFAAFYYISASLKVTCN